MSEPFLSEIRMFSFGYAPNGWALCNGQTLPISQNQALFSLLGTTFGGNGVSNFNLPDLRGRAPLHASPTYPQGASGGEITHLLQQSEMPPVPHTHSLNVATQNGTQILPGGNLLASSATQLYVAPSQPAAMNAGAVQVTGGQPHENMQPYLAINFSIALTGIYPSRN